MTDRGRWGMEVAVVLCLGVLPPLSSALLAGMHGAVLPPPTFQWVALLVRSIQVVVPTLYVVHQSGEGWAAFGLHRWSFRSDLAVGLALAFAARSVSVGVSSLAGRWGAGFAPQVQSHFREAFQVNGWTFSLMLVALAANSCAEELVMRSFLIRRFGQLLGHRSTAVFLSALLFGAYHVYQGSAPAVAVFATGLLFGAVYVYQGRLAPLVIAHTLVNLANSWRP